MIPDATGPIRDMHENVMDQRGSYTYYYLLLNTIEN